MPEIMEGPPMWKRKVLSLVLGLMLAACFGGLFSCSRTYYGDDPDSEQYDPVEVLVPEQISAASSTKITFSHCIYSDGLSLTLTRENDQSEVPIQVTPGPVSEEGCIQEVSFAPETELEDQARYILDIDFPAFNYTFIVTASLIFEFRPGVYLTLTGGGPLDSFSEKLRTWFVEFGEPDEDGFFDIWHVDADAPDEDNGEPICFGWSAQPSSDVGRGIGWSTYTRGVLNQDGTQFSTPEGEVMDIEVKPLVCVKGGRYEGIPIPTGDTISGKFSVERLEIPCGLPSSASQAVYSGDRCPEGTVLPHE
jgi:hypothetical protein